MNTWIGWANWLEENDLPVDFKNSEKLKKIFFFFLIDETTGAETVSLGTLGSQVQVRALIPSPLA